MYRIAWFRLRKSLARQQDAAKQQRDESAKLQEIGHAGLPSPLPGAGQVFFARQLPAGSGAVTPRPCLLPPPSGQSWSPFWGRIWRGWAFS